MSTTSPALLTASALQQYFPESSSHEDAFVCEPLLDPAAQYSTESDLMSEVLAHWSDQLVADVPSSPGLVRVWRTTVSRLDPLSLNVPIVGRVERPPAVRFSVPAEDSDSCPVFISASDLDHFSALLAFPTVGLYPTAVDADHSVPSPSLSSVVEAQLAEFSAGLDRVRPTDRAVRIATVLCEAAVQYVENPEITVDVDGELSFDLRLKDGRLVFAELGLDGRLDVGVYGPDNKMLEHDAHATCDYFVMVIES